MQCNGIEKIKQPQKSSISMQSNIIKTIEAYNEQVIKWIHQDKSCSNTDDFIAF